MEFSDSTKYPRHYDKAIYPVVAHIEILASEFSDLDRRAADQTQVKVIGHDEADDGLLVVHVACTTEIARKRFERRWG